MIEKKSFFLENKRIYLRPLDLNDLNGNYKFWLNDPQITEFNSHGRYPLTLAILKEYIESSVNSKSTIVLAIIDKESDFHVGNISLQKINWVDRNAEIAFLLGEKEFWGKGIMMDAGRLLINHAFSTLNLHRLYCGTSASNLGMQKLAMKLGFTKEGTRREAIFNEDEFWDIIDYGLLKVEYLEYR